MTALIPVAGREFILATRSDQEALLAGWGDVLNQFAIDRGVVTHISWTAYTRRSTMDEHLTWLDEHEAVDDADAAIEGYRELVNSAAVGTAEHEVIVSLTVARDRLARQRGGVIESQTALGNALVDSTEAVLRSLRSAGLSAAEPLNTLQVRRLLRTCMEPDAATRALRGTLAERLALTVAVSPGPVALETTWSHLRIDNALHRTYWVATWPRLGMPPSWLEPFLGAADGVRAMTVVFSPVSPYQSRRRIERDLVKLESDAAMKEEKGRRVDARHRRATQSLLTREEELVAGFAEMGYVGLVTVSANTLEDLQRSGDVVEQHAREVGMELRSLVGRQDLAWAAALPFGLAPRNGIV
jgi:hypothetical protein